MSKQTATDAAGIVERTRDQVRGMVAVAAQRAGWPRKMAAYMAIAAEPSFTTRMIEGAEPKEALKASMGDVGLMASMDMFSARMSVGATPIKALEAVLEHKRKSIPDEKQATAMHEAAVLNFKMAMAAGLGPHAALISADIAAKAAARLITTAREQAERKDAAPAQAA